MCLSCCVGMIKAIICSAIIFFILGAGIGFIAGWFGHKKYIEVRYKTTTLRWPFEMTTPIPPASKMTLENSESRLNKRDVHMERSMKTLDDYLTYRNTQNLPSLQSTEDRHIKALYERIAAKALEELQHYKATTNAHAQAHAQGRDSLDTYLANARPQQGMVDKDIKTLQYFLKDKDSALRQLLLRSSLNRKKRMMGRVGA